MRTTVRELKRLIGEADRRLKATGIEKALQSAPADPELDNLKRDLRTVRAQIAKFEKMERMGKRHGQDLDAMRAYAAELQEKIKLKQG
jgi:hypothetical protein